MERSRLVRVPVRDLGCGDAPLLERALARTDGVLAVHVDAATETAYIEMDPTRLGTSSLTEAIARSGFRAGRPSETSQIWIQPPSMEETDVTDQHSDDIDPVCGMRVRASDPIHAAFEGVTYRFCDPACADIFRADPRRWAGDGEPRGFVHDHRD